ncbi:MAG TPA: calcium-binding EGF-like domain-containing protein [Nannocystaceae bacterium]|nr:calcium-binding EGF-like domain-containing protein [Nannocystaceae bacterium]
MTRVFGLAIAATLGGCGFDSSGSTAGQGGSTGGESSTTEADGAVTTDVTTDGSQSAGADSTTSVGPDDTTGAGTTASEAGASESSTGAVDPCAVDNGGCDEDATCSLDDDGEVDCECDDGFEGDGEECTVVPALAMLRWNLPCGVDLGDTCTADMTAMDSAVLVGEPGVIYTVELRVRGVLESKAYANGTDDGAWYIGGDPVIDGGWNETTLEVSDPPQLFRYNNGTRGVWEPVAVDVTRTIHVTAGATVTIAVDTENAIIIDNDDGVVVPDVAPAPEAYDGQFAQVDILSIEL